jgi:hypothetical protein
MPLHMDKSLNHEASPSRRTTHKLCAIIDDAK